MTRIYYHRSLMLVLCLIVFAPGLQAQYMDNFKYERRLARKLISMRIPMKDFAAYQIELMAKAFANDSDGVNLLYAELYIAKKQRKKAVGYLAKIKKGSSRYPDACRMRAKYATSPQEKAQAYKEYFSTLRGAPQDPDEIPDFVNDVLLYNKILLQQNKTREAARVMEWLKKLPKKSQINPHMLTYLSARSALDSIDKEIANGDTAAAHAQEIQKAFKDLQNLTWNMDYVASLAYGEMAHALVLQGKPDEALKTLNTAASFLQSMEQAIKKSTRSLVHSPLATAYFYIAASYYLKARAIRRKDREAAKDFLIKAINKYYKVATIYKGCALELPAMAKVSLIKEVLEKKFDTKVDFGKGEEQRANYKAGVALYQSRDFARAADKFMQAAAVDLKGQIAPDALKFAAVCMYKTKQFLAAMAVTDFLADWWPHADDTHTALFNLGVTLAKEARKKPKNSPEALSLREDSNIVFRRFVTVAPRHPKAAWAAYRVAEYEYAQATAIRKEKQKMAKKGVPVAKLNKKITEMRQAYLRAVPIYNVLTQNYGSTDQGAKAYYKLGWIYHIVGDDEKSADNFLNYCASEERPVEEKVEAKFFAADHLMRSGNVDDAIDNFKELLQWGGKDSPYPKNAKTKRYEENAEGLLAWCYDQQFRQLQTQIADLDKQLARMAKDTKKAAAVPAKKKNVKKVAKKKTGKTEEEKLEEQGPKPVLIKEEDPKIKRVRLQKKMETARKNALQGFLTFVKNHPKSEQTPANMAKLGSLYLEQKDYKSATFWLEKLSKEFAGSNEAKSGLFSLGRAYCEVGQWDKASETFKKLIPNMKDMPAANLSYIAGKLNQPPPNEKKSALSSDVVIAANLEIIRRTESPQHPDYAKLLPKRERALYRAGEAYVRAGNLEKGVEYFDRIMAEVAIYNRKAKAEKRPTRVSPYYYDILFRKGEAYTAAKQYGLAERSYNEILTYLSADKNPADYYEAVVKAGRVLLLEDKPKAVRKAAARFQQVIQFADASKKGVKEWLEEAYYDGARTFSLLGDTVRANKLKEEYRTHFPHGKYREKILSLPPPKYREEKKAPAAK